MGTQAIVRTQGHDHEIEAEPVDERADLLDLAQDAIFVRDFDTGAIRYWNRGAERLYGWSAEEALGKVSHVLLKTRFPEPLSRVEAVLASDDYWEGELVHTSRDGAQIVVSTRWALRRDSADRPMAILEVNTDITRRRAAEETLREQAALLELVPDAILVRDYTTGTIQYWNSGAETLYGWSAAEAIGRNSDDLLGTRLPRALDEICVELGEAGQWEGEVEQVTRGGYRVTVASRWALRRSETGEPEDILIISTDITRRKEAELEVSRLVAAQAALQERDQLLATVSHDLKTPLTAIRGQADILLRDIEQSGELDVQRARKGLLLLRTAATRMATWIDDLLDMARLDAGRSVELHRQPMDLVALAWQAVADHQRNTERHRLRVRTSESRLIGVWDSVRLRRVLDNLLSNAVKYSPEGGDVDVVVEHEGDTARVSVTDHGVGIPADDLPHIFERFGRARNVIGRIGGTGIGLHGVCQIVRDHGGRIEVESEEGRGTTFTLHLPLFTDDIGT
jgi:PAS domain S-box-containing protein